MFFGMIRSAGGCNDHPDTPTFLQLYKILSLFGIMRPPKKGNCTVVEPDKSHQRIIEMVDLKNIFQAKPSEDFLSNLSKNLNIVINDEGWKLEEITINNGSKKMKDCSKGGEESGELPEAIIVQNIIYYIAGCLFYLYIQQ